MTASGVLSQRKLELLDRLLASKGIRTSSRGEEIPVAALDGGRCRLSFAQQRLWVLERLQPGLAAYNIPSAFRLDGPLDADALQRALAALAARHPVLNASFVEDNGQPFQRFDATPPALRVEDMAGEDAGAREAQAMRVCAEEAHRPFDLLRERPLRVRLLRVDPQSHVLSVLMHHIASDAWSIGLFIRELVELYAAAGAQREPALPPLRIHYGDFAEWQHQASGQDRYAQQLDFWARTLDGAPTLLALPTDRPRPSMQRFEGESEPFRIEPALADALRRIAQERNATLFMVLMAAYQVLLYRLGAGEDLVVGTPVAGRSRSELEPLIGMFVNTLAIRGRIDAVEGFDALIERTRRDALDAFAHQDVAFEQVVERLQPERHTDRAPLFQTMLVLQNVPQGGGEVAGMRISQLNLHNGTSKFDLTLFLLDGDDALHATFEYNRTLFDAATVAGFRRCFLNLLEAIVQDPAYPVAQLPLLDATQRATMLETWQGPMQPAPAQPVHLHIRQQALATPDAVAVRAGDAVLRYRELDQAALRLAARLRAAGVGTETRVGIAVARSPQMVVAVLGVLYAGAAYVPLDAAAPDQRLAFQVDDAGIGLVVSDQALAGRLPSSIVQLPVQEPAIDGTDDGDHAPAPVAMDQLAYVLYTSGSTGRPKGVEVSHLGLANYLLNWCVPAYDMAGGTGAPLHSSLGFDLSVTSLLGPLAAGCTVSLVSTQDEIENLHAQLREGDAFSLAKITPAHLEILDRLFERAPQPANVRALVVGGEALPSRLVASWKRRDSQTRIFNEYGPTETVVGCCVEEVGAEIDENASVPIGRPIANTRMYVLDRDGGLAPPGAVGELHIGGMGVARGYTRRPALTAERFVPDPYAAVPGARMYRSGDLGRHRADGTLLYHGRIDAQVKLRGYRIELGEIEACLRQVEGVVDAAACLADGGALAAFVVAHDDASRTAVERIVSELRQWLPEYMVPTALAWINAVPLTANGKVDRERLSRSDCAVPLRAASSAPSTPEAQLLATIWADVLSIAEVGADDDFFALGGHSMLALQTVSRIREAFGVELPLRVLFESRTVAALAQRIAGERRATTLPALVRADRDGPLPLSFAQQRLWFLHRLAPQDPVFNVSYALRLGGPLDEQALRAALDALVARHEVLRTGYPTIGGEARQRIHAQARAPLAFVDLRDRADPGREAIATLREQVRTPIDIVDGDTPLRVTLLRTGEQEHFAALVVHHIASDAWSTEVMARELMALYEAFAAGRPSPLAPLEFQYADFAAWQRRTLDEARIAAEIGHWRERLGERPPVLQLPTDRPRRSRVAAEGALHATMFDADLRERLLRFAAAHAVTPFMAMLAAFQIVLQRYSGQRDFVIGTPVAERGHPGLDGAIGMFLNLLPLRAQLEGDLDVGQLLERVRATTLDAFAHGTVPFERLVDAFRLDRDLASTPLFQVMFTYQHAAQQAFALPGMDIRAVEVEPGSARYELTLFVIDDGRELSVRVEYDAGLYDAATIEQITHHLRSAIEAMIAAAAQRIDTLSLLAADEREQVIEGWNHTDTAYPLSRTLHALIAAHAHGDTPAAFFPDARLNHAELDRRAGRLAAFLRSRGVGRETIVGLCTIRSPDMLVGMLGILKAGAAYLPLDPEYPVDRLAYMLGDASVRIVLTQAALLDSLPAEGAERICLDRDWDALVAAAADADAPDADDPDAMAYVIYTSGSTGRPKGTMVSHRSAVNHAFAMIDLYGLDRDTRFSQHFSLSFDGSVEDFFPVLVAGGALLLPPNPARHTLRETLDFYARHGITALHLPTAVWHQFATALHEGQLQLPDSLRITSAGGEALASDKLRDYLHDTGGRVPFLNVYGPTEATVTASTLRVASAASEYVRRNLPIGRPLPNVRLYVLDEQLAPVPVRVPGELYIGGVGVARGYLGRPALTAERFVPDPYGAPGDRLYRTGDRVRHLADGVLDYLGRIDQQTKIRSFRIELAEIEVAMATHPAVAEVVVDVRRGRDDDDRRIVAYYVPASGVELADNAALRAHLARFLPPFMLPAALVQLPWLPLTPNGKIDRARLPEPDYATQSNRIHVPPRTPAEARVAGHWASVLDLDEVGVEDNFFEVGGHSLLIVHLHERLQREYAREIPLVALFEHATIARQAEYMEPSVATAAAQPVDEEGWARDRRRALARRRDARRRDRTGADV